MGTKLTRQEIEKEEQKRDALKLNKKKLTDLKSGKTIKK